MKHLRDLSAVLIKTFLILRTFIYFGSEGFIAFYLSMTVILSLNQSAGCCLNNFCFYTVVIFSFRPFLDDWILHRLSKVVSLCPFISTVSVYANIFFNLFCTFYYFHTLLIAVHFDLSILLLSFLYL